MLLVNSTEHPLLFDSEEDCCAVHVCGTTNTSDPTANPSNRPTTRDVSHVNEFVALVAISDLNDAVANVKAKRKFLDESYVTTQHGRSDYESIEPTIV